MRGDAERQSRGLIFVGLLCSQMRSSRMLLTRRLLRSASLPIYTRPACATTKLGAPFTPNARVFCSSTSSGNSSAEPAEELILPQYPSLARHLDTLLARHATIERELAEGSVAFSADTMKELARLTPLVETRQEALTLAREVAELRELAMDSSAETELRQLARTELQDGEARLTAAEEQLISQLVPPEEGDDRGVVLEVRAGAGGLEAGLFAKEVVEMYEKVARRQRWRFELLDSNESDVGGIKDATATISGDGAYGFLKFESGVHRVQRVPATESQGRVHTSTIIVLALPAPDENTTSELVIPESEIQVDTYRSGGKGGQSVNTTDSAVRLTHKPTGIKVAIQNERSQHANKRTALQILTARVADHYESIARAETDKARQEVDSTGSRSERIRTYNWADDRVTDHRLSGSKFGIPRMMEGELLEELAADLKAQLTLQRRDAFVKKLNAEAAPRSK